MSIIDNVAELRARLEEIEAEKAAARERDNWPSNAPVHTPAPPAATTHDEDLYPMLCGGGHAVMIYNEPSLLSRWSQFDPGPVQIEPCYLSEMIAEPLRIPELQTKIEVLRAQVRLHDRLRAETLQALRETEKEIITLRCRHPSGE